MDKQHEHTPAEARDFIIKLGVAAHGYGSTSARLERFLDRLARTLGHKATFRAAPLELVCAFEDEPGEPQQVYLLPLPGTGMDLAKLAALGNLIAELESGKVSLADALVRLDKIAQAPAPWGTLAIALSYVVTGPAIAVLFSGSWWDAGCAAALSLIVFGMVNRSARWGPRFAAWLPLSTAFVAAALAVLIRLAVPQLNVVLVTVSAIIILVPGYGITLGLIELAGQKIVSGATNLMGGLVYLAKQLAGAWLGAELVVRLLGTSPATPAVAVDPVWVWVMLPPLIVGLCVVFQTPRRDFLAAASGCFVAYLAIVAGSTLEGGNTGNLFGTIAAVLFANLWAIRTKRPTSIVLLPAIVLLVSGSIGFRGLAAMTQGQIQLGWSQFLQMFVVGLTIGAGVFIANTIVQSRDTL